MKPAARKREDEGKAQTCAERTVSRSTTCNVLQLETWLINRRTLSIPPHCPLCVTTGFVNVTTPSGMPTSNVPF